MACAGCKIVLRLLLTADLHLGISYLAVQVFHDVNVECQKASLVLFYDYATQNILEVGRTPRNVKRHGENTSPCLMPESSQYGMIECMRAELL